MTVIWYNPDIDRYEVGLQPDYVVITALSKNADRFEVLHEFDTTIASTKIAKKIIVNLNQIRYKSSTNQEFFA
ncbi:MAG: hypothetical protein GY816_14655 [Cytophagales bacterium]|nr:hypothetical protein [Cytophagales bacterium]